MHRSKPRSTSDRRVTPKAALVMGCLSCTISRPRMAASSRSGAAVCRGRCRHSICRCRPAGRNDPVSTNAAASGRRQYGRDAPDQSHLSIGRASIMMTHSNGVRRCRARFSSAIAVQRCALSTRWHTMPCWVRLAQCLRTISAFIDHQGAHSQQDLVFRYQQQVGGATFAAYRKPQRCTFAALFDNPDLACHQGLPIAGKWQARGQCHRICV